MPKHLPYTLLLCLALLLGGCEKFLTPKGQWEQLSSAPFSFYPSKKELFVIKEKAYIGLGNGSIELWEYSPTKDFWQQRANFPGTVRKNAVAFAIGEKGYYGLGLDTSNSTVLNDVWEYTATTDQWKQINNFPDTVALEGLRNTAAFSIHNKGYACIHRNESSEFEVKEYTELWEYSPETNKWKRKNNLPGYERDGFSCFTIEEEGYLLFNSESATHNFWKYNPENDIWKKRASHPSVNGSVRDVNICSFSINGKGYAGLGGSHYWDIGGIEERYYNGFWEYNPKTNKWKQLNNFSGEPREGAIGFSIGRNGYVMGGNIGTWYNEEFKPEYLSDCYRFAP